MFISEMVHGQHVQFQAIRPVNGYWKMRDWIMVMRSM